MESETACQTEAGAGMRIRSRSYVSHYSKAEAERN